jgi:hypothetical protein
VDDDLLESNNQCQSISAGPMGDSIMLKHVTTNLQLDVYDVIDDMLLTMPQLHLRIPTKRYPAYLHPTIQPIKHNKGLCLFTRGRRHRRRTFASLLKEQTIR